jgi:hypothetical protein
MRLLAAGLVAFSAAFITTSVAGAQSVPVEDEPASIGEPPQSPVEPPTNDGGTGNAGAAPASGSAAGLPSAGSGGGTEQESLVAAGALALVLAVAGATTIRVARRNRA